MNSIAVVHSHMSLSQGYLVIVCLAHVSSAKCRTKYRLHECKQIFLKYGNFSSTLLRKNVLFVICKSKGLKTQNYKCSALCVCVWGEEMGYDMCELGVSV